MSRHAHRIYGKVIAECAADAPSISKQLALFVDEQDDIAMILRILAGAASIICRRVGSLPSITRQARARFAARSIYWLLGADAAHLCS